MASSTEDIQNQFKSLNKWFNNLMSPKNYCFKDGNILTILKKMLKMINEDNYKIQVESIINTHLLLTNLHKALSGFKQFRVISMENVRELYDPYSDQLCLSFIPAEGETSLQIFKDEITVMSCSETFRDAQRILWPKVKASHDPNENPSDEQRLVFYISGKEQDFRFSLYQALLYQYWRDDNDFDASNDLRRYSLHKITYRRLTSNFGPKFVADFSDLESQVILHFLGRVHKLGIESPEAFVNHGLDKKLNDQLDDEFVTESGVLPPWWIYVVMAYPFLFRYQTRIRYFKLVEYLQSNPFSLETMANTLLSQEKKAVVARDRLLHHAKPMMNELAREHIVLSVSFMGEIGTGQIVGKAIQNGKRLDIHFSRAFYKLVLGKELSIYDIQYFEPHLGNTLLEFKELVGKPKLTELDNRYKGGSIEDLCLSFVLPGYEEFISEYKKDVPVDLINLEDYVTFVKDGTVGSGITVQMEAFKEGLKQVFNLSGPYLTAIQTFSIFTEEEFEANLCGQAENSWSLEELNEHIILGGGYMQESVPIVNLFEILQGFNLEQRRGFLQFVTATPRLPYGGLASLSPILKVEKISLTEESLPCAATCSHQLLLPPYLSKDKMKEKLLYAITEGQGSFSYR